MRYSDMPRLAAILDGFILLGITGNGKFTLSRGVCLFG